MTRVLLFLSSLSPGVVVVAIRYLEQDWWLGAIGFLVGVLLMPIGLLAVHQRGKVIPIPTQFRERRDETYQVPTYLVTFILPFLFVELQSLYSVAAYLVFIAFVATILSKIDISIVNPGLLIFGYRLYDMIGCAGERVTVISKTRPSLTTFENLRPLSGDLFLLESKESDPS